MAVSLHSPPDLPFEIILSAFIRRCITYGTGMSSELNQCTTAMHAPLKMKVQTQRSSFVPMAIWRTFFAAWHKPYKKGYLGITNTVSYPPSTSSEISAGIYFIDSSSIINLHTILDTTQRARISFVRRILEFACALHSSEHSTRYFDLFTSARSSHGNLTSRCT
jgi:hypothetical protein